MTCATTPGRSTEVKLKTFFPGTFLKRNFTFQNKWSKGPVLSKGLQPTLSCLSEVLSPLPHPVSLFSSQPFLWAPIFSARSRWTDLTNPHFSKECEWLILEICRSCPLVWVTGKVFSPSPSQPSPVGFYPSDFCLCVSLAFTLVAESTHCPAQTLWVFLYHFLILFLKHDGNFESGQ